MTYSAVIDTLLKSDEPSIRRKVLVNILGESPSGRKAKALQLEIKHSPRVKALLRHRNSKGEIISGANIYSKWQGAHWILAALAELGYPAGDKSLNPVKDQLLNCWLSDYFYKETVVDSKTKSYKAGGGVPLMQGRYRRCASQQALALWSVITLELTDRRLADIIERLLHWQWPDGGWNCDRNPDADTSSFMETQFPLRALHLYAKVYKDKSVAAAAARAAEVFLTRRLYKSAHTGKVIHPEFTYLHYPLYWHYDILGALKIMAETGFIADPRCSDALDLLESKALASGGFPAERAYYRTSSVIKLGNDFVNWGGTSKRKVNEWVTADALFVLSKAGRLRL
jgi:hypothetical protein